MNINFYNCEIYKNKREENILMVFTTDALMTIEIGRRELKSFINYEDIKDLIQTDTTKLKISFKREINEVIFINYKTI